MNAVLSIILVTSTNLVSADTIDDVLFDTAIDLILFDGKEVVRTYSAFDYDTCRKQLGSGHGKQLTLQIK